MTVSTEVDHNDYIGNGVTTVFPYQFRIFKAADLTVVTVDLNENQRELILGTDYTVTGAGSYQGGNVILVSALANGWKISIARELPVTQETDLRNQGKFFAEVHENAFDKLTMLIQQTFSRFSLALRKPSFIANYYDALNNRIRNLRDPSQSQDAATKNYVDSLTNTNLSKTLRTPEVISSLPDAVNRANKMPAFNHQGDAIVVVPPSGSASDVMIELAKPTGYEHIGVQPQGNISQLLTYITPEQFAEQYPGETNWAVMINKAYEYARENGKTVLLANVYHIRTSIIHYDGVRVINSGKIICDPAGDYSVNTPSGPENAAYLITTKNGMYNQIKGMYLNSLYIAHTEDVETTGYTAPAINAKGVVISDIASITIGSIKTFGFLLGGVDVGGPAGKGYEIRILDATSWIYQWTDSNIAGFVVNVQDSTFNDIAPTGYGVGIDMKQGMNVYVNPHPWGYPLTANNMYPNRQMKIGFRIRSGGNTLIRPYADTISRVTASSVNDLTNGGIAFYIENWRNVITATAVMAHSEDISTGMAICYMSDAKLNIFELSTVVNTGKFIAEKVMYVSPETLFTNSFTGNFWAGANDMSGNSKLNGTGLTSSGTYRLIRSNGMVSISFILSISAVSSPSGPLTLPLPRGLTLYYGGNNSASVRTCFTMPSDVVDVLAISNGSNIEFYFVGSNGSRTKATASSVKTGLLEVVVFGMLSN